MGFFLFLILLCSLLGVYIAGQKGRSTIEGFVFGLLLGPIGLIIVACLPTRTADMGQSSYVKPATSFRNEAAEAFAEAARKAKKESD
jgi:hypothetical protein